MGPAADRSAIEIDPERLQEWLGREPHLQVIDVREPYEREAGHIEGTRHIELTRLSSEAASLDPTDRSSSTAA
jgi:Rhodanese-like domain.